MRRVDEPSRSSSLPSADTPAADQPVPVVVNFSYIRMVKYLRHDGELSAGDREALRRPVITLSANEVLALTSNARYAAALHDLDVRLPCKIANLVENDGRCGAGLQLVCSCVYRHRVAISASFASLSGPIFAPVSSYIRVARSSGTFRTPFSIMLQ